MIYLKDTLSGAVRQFDEKIPKEARKAKGFQRSRLYTYDSDEKRIESSRGGRWVKSNKKAYDAWVEGQAEHSAQAEKKAKARHEASKG